MCRRKNRLPECVGNHVYLLRDVNLILSETTLWNCVPAALPTLGSSLISEFQPSLSLLQLFRTGPRVFMSCDTAECQWDASSS